MYEKLVIITHICQRAKCYFTSMSNTWYLLTVPTMNRITTFFSQISQKTLQMYEKIFIITQIWERAKFYSTCMSNSWYLITVPNITKIQSAIMEYCSRMDWEMHCWTGPFPIPWFSLGGVENNNTTTHQKHITKAIIITGMRFINYGSSVNYVHILSMLQLSFILFAFTQSQENDAKLPFHF